MAKILDAVFFGDSKKPKCPKCQYSLNEISIHDYGVEDGKIFYISPCELCDTLAKYFTDEKDNVIKTKIIERKNTK